MLQKMPPKCSRWHIEDYLIFGLLVLVLVVLFVGCATTPVRLGPGECVVIPDRIQVITAGSDCQVRRLYR